MSVSHEHERLIDLLHDVNRKMAEHVREVFRGQEIPLAFRAVGAVLMSEPGVTVSGLARRTGMAKSHISNTVEELCRRGWVEKRGDPEDQRLLRLYLTPSAVEHRWRQVRDAMRERLAEVVAEIPDDQASALMDGLLALQAAPERVKERGRAE